MTDLENIQLLKETDSSSNTAGCARGGRRTAVAAAVAARVMVTAGTAAIGLQKLMLSRESNAHRCVQVHASSYAEQSDRPTHAEN